MPSAGSGARRSAPSPCRARRRRRSTSSSRIEPPGWMTASAPALAASSTPSRNGKNASEATTEPASGARALRDRDPHRIDARHLAGADPERAPVAGEHDRVRLDVLGDAPREVEIAQLGGGRRRFEATCPSAAAGGSRRASGPGSRPTTLRSSTAPAASPADSPASEQAQVLLRRQQRERFGREGRRDHALEEGLGQLARQLLVDRTVDRHDAAERRHRVGVARAAVRRRRRPPGDRDAARVVVLDDRHRRRRELGDDAHRRVEIEQVVVRQLLALQHLGARERRPGRVVRRRTPPSGAGSRRSAASAPAPTEIDRLREVGERRVAASSCAPRYDAIAPS